LKLNVNLNRIEYKNIDIMFSNIYFYVFSFLLFFRYRWN